MLPSTSFLIRLVAFSFGSGPVAHGGEAQSFQPVSPELEHRGPASTGTCSSFQDENFLLAATTLGSYYLCGRKTLKGDWPCAALEGVEPLLPSFLQPSSANP